MTTSKNSEWLKIQQIVTSKISSGSSVRNAIPIHRAIEACKEYLDVVLKEKGLLGAIPLTKEGLEPLFLINDTHYRKCALKATKETNHEETETPSMGYEFGFEDGMLEMRQQMITALVGKFFAQEGKNSNSLEVYKLLNTLLIYVKADLDHPDEFQAKESFELYEKIEKTLNQWGNTH